MTPGSYILTVEDANGCEDEVTFIISEPDELTVTLTVNLNNLGNVVNLYDSVLLTSKCRWRLRYYLLAAIQCFWPVILN
ncbi:MAG: hypothetical protein R2784_16470 [Saprospiraceae bacterium]